MQDYKETLNLPNTDFPMRANLAQREPQLLEFWKKINLYKKLREAGKNKEKYILHDGPPYANGRIHLGHAVNKTLKDIILKSKTLNGYDTPYVMGWDCHGLPIELNVEKKVGKAGEKISPDAFREACRQYAATQVDIQKTAFKRLGVIGDFDHPYLSMDRSYEANTIRALARMMEKGHLQHGQKPVHWCIDCKSALAEAEVEYKDKTSTAVDVRFKCIDANVLFQHLKIEHSALPVSLPIWTTTPWTLPANQAVAVGKEIQYSLIQTSSEYLILASELVESALERYQVNEYQVISTFSGDVLVQLILKHPLLPREVPVVLGHHVTLEVGTGAVHIAPAHGLDDYEIGMEYQLPIDNPVGANGCYDENAPLLSGQFIYKANPAIVDLLRDNQTLLFTESLEHSYPHCWRHKSPLIFRATSQWFISMDKQHLRKQTLAAIEVSDWIPEWGEARIFKMIKDRPDWCISRQRTWGTPLPLFIHKKTKQLHSDMYSLMMKIADIVEKEGIDAWFNLPVEALLKEEDAQDYVKVHDSLDVWFDAGVSHTCVLKTHPDLHFPADLYLEGSDQYRGWFNSSIMTATALYGTSPYKAVLTHGFTVDAKGHKMSKSLGNVIEPDKIVNTFGADILRLWVASTDYCSEMNVSDDIIKQASERYRRIRNTARFMLSNLWDFEPEVHLKEVENNLWYLDQLAIDDATAIQQEMLEDYEQFQLHNVCKKIHHFCNDTMGGFYLDIVKDRLYTLPKNSVGRRSAQVALYHLLNKLVHWIAPILSFTAEEIWQSLKGIDHTKVASVFLSTWESSEKITENTELAQLKAVKTEVNKLLENHRSDGKIGSSLNAEVTLYCDVKENPSLYELLTNINQQEIDNPNKGMRFILITSKADVLMTDEMPTEVISTNISGLSLVIQPSTHEKCIRCWHQRADVNQDKEFPSICSRCVKNLQT